MLAHTAALTAASRPCLAGRAIVLFGWIIRRLTLRLAFSYFLIGIVPIPLIAAMALAASYIVAHQFVATRMRRETTAIGSRRALLRAGPSPRRPHGRGRGPILRRPLALPGSPAAWLRGLERSAFVEAEDGLWLAVPETPQSVRLLGPLGPGLPLAPAPGGPTGYEVELILGDASTENRGLRVESRRQRARDPDPIQEPRAGIAGPPPRRAAEVRRRDLEGRMDPRLLPRDPRQRRRGREEDRAQRRDPQGHDLPGGRRRPALPPRASPESANVFWIVFVVIGVLLLLVSTSSRSRSRSCWPARSPATSTG